MLTETAFEVRPEGGIDDHATVDEEDCSGDILDVFDEAVYQYLGGIFPSVFR